ncbi:MAG: PAS domain-containing sensor histidine kinase, partial [Alphaproteobacteria bacterium]|nr:PAS domain-containing sensor histidine kinase [Alphaproteobacteria bacterium]
AEATVVERDRLQAVLDAAPFAIWQRDERGRLIWVNGAYARQVGLGRDEALRNGVELEPLGERGLAQALAARARESGATASERRLLAVEGEPRRFDVIECPVGGAGGTAGFALDASEAEDVQADLERQVAAQADLLDELDIGVAIWGSDRRLVYANGAAARLWRVEPEWLARAPEHGELLERLRQNRRLPEQADFPAFKRARLALQDNLAQPVEGIDHLPDGTAIRWRVFASRLGGAVFTHADVTERFTLERDRASAVALQRATIDNLRTAVTVVGSDGRVKLFNPALARLSGLDSAVLARQPHVEEVVDLIRPLLPERDDWAETRRRRIAFALERRGREGQFALRDGRTLNWFQAPLPDGNSLFGFLDVTDSTRVEAALRGRAEALEAADRFKRAFLANAAYDLRTPITTIAGFAEMLLRRYFGELNPRQLDYARGILHSAETLNDLITDVIDLAGAEAGHVALETARLDLQELLADALEIQRNRATARGVVVDLDCALDIGEITGDVRRLRRALDRLVANAIDRTPPGEPVVVGAAKEGQQATLWIADGGPPLDEAEREGFFEPFAGATRESLRRPGGGAGLSLARRVVELHGGRAEVAHNADKGACVILRLPVDGPGSKIAP